MDGFVIDLDFFMVLGFLYDTLRSSCILQSNANLV